MWTKDDWLTLIISETQVWLAEEFLLPHFMIMNVVSLPASIQDREVAKQIYASWIESLDFSYWDLFNSLFNDYFISNIIYRYVRYAHLCSFMLGALPILVTLYYVWRVRDFPVPSRSQAGMGWDRDWDQFVWNRTRTRI